MTAATAVAALNTLDQGKPQLLGLHWTRVNKSQAWSWMPWTWSQGTLAYPVPWRPPRHTLQPHCSLVYPPRLLNCGVHAEEILLSRRRAKKQPAGVLADGSSFFLWP